MIITSVASLHQWSKINHCFILRSLLFLVHTLLKRHKNIAFFAHPKTFPYNTPRINVFRQKLTKSKGFWVALTYLNLFASHHFRPTVDDYQLVQMGGLDGFSHGIAVGIAGNLGGGFLQKFLHLVVAGAALAILQLDDI